MNRYTSIEADQRPRKEGETFLGASSDEFFRRFFAWRGNDQETYGLALSLLQAFSAGISAIKKWEKAGFPEDGQAKNMDEDIDALFSQCCYWIADMHVRKETSPAKRLYWKIRRRLRV